MAEQPQTPKSPLDDFLTHQRKAADETAKALSALIPPDFRTHSRTAKEEFLKSFKVLIEGTADAIDHELNRMRSTQGGSGGDSGTGHSTTGKSKVKVDVS